MTADEEITVPSPDEIEAPEAETLKKKPGRKSAAEIRAEIEAEVRAELAAEADVSTMREQIRAEMEAERAAIEAKAEADRKLAAEARPIRGTEIDGDPSIEGSITVHFLDDGLTLLGKVWYRGEELTINPGTENWEMAHPVLSMDEYAQEEKWGKRFFRPGPWRGKRLDEIDDEILDDKERAQLAKAQKIREERYGPVLT